MNIKSHQTFVKFFTKAMFEAWFPTFIDFCYRKSNFVFIYNLLYQDMQVML